MQPTLFDVSDPPGALGRYALWHRRSRRGRWRLVGTAPTGPAAYALMDAPRPQGRRATGPGGDWMVVDGPGDPNARPPAANTGRRRSVRDS
jgi:hypothetical protein